jgi:hypothetical protein
MGKGRKAGRLLDKSEGSTTATGSAGHARGQHSAESVSLESGPSVDSHLIGELSGAAVGAVKSAFLNDRDQNRAASYALDNGTETESNRVVGRRTKVAQVKEGLNQISVRVAKVRVKGAAPACDCWNAKLRAITLVYDREGDSSKMVVVTCYPSGFHPTSP